MLVLLRLLLCCRRSCRERWRCSRCLLSPRDLLRMAAVVPLGCMHWCVDSLLVSNFLYFCLSSLHVGTSPPVKLLPSTCFITLHLHEAAYCALQCQRAECTEPKFLIAARRGLSSSRAVAFGGAVENMHSFIQHTTGVSGVLEDLNAVDLPDADVAVVVCGV